MVTRPDDGSAGQGHKGTTNDPPYPMSPKSEKIRPIVRRHTKPQASSSKAFAGPGDSGNADSESDWEKDGMDDGDDDESDWEFENRPGDVADASSSHRPGKQPGLPAALQAGPGPGAVVGKKSGENLMAAHSQVSLPATSFAPSFVGESQISLPHYTIPPQHISSENASQIRSYTTTPLNAGDEEPNTYHAPQNYAHNSQQPPAYAPAEPYIHPPPAEPINKQSTGERIFGVEGSPHHSNARVTYDGVAELPALPTPRDEVSQPNLGPPSPYHAQPPLIPVEAEDGGAVDPWAPAGSGLGFGARPPVPNLMPPMTEPPRPPPPPQDWERTEREREQQRQQVEAAIARENEQQAEAMRRAEQEWRSAEDREREQDAEMRREEERADYPATAADVMPDGSPIPPPPPRPARQPLRSALRQAPEHYAIKQLRWYDARINKLRTSPILIQNVNGPCPLLALVNALVLSTPESEQTGLIETLRTREQVSLDLVIDAVFDELTSGQRATTNDLPDVGELLKFLRNLHSGMNVNPRFTYLPACASQELHPAYRPTEGPGGFEETKEMSLYSVFNVQLVHGWIPARESAAYQAFQRSAQTYEDAQNIQFFEEELEHKLSTSGLTAHEQQTFEDLNTIKDFLQSWPTQLTDVGLRTLLDHIKPGTFCIMFRNDHFSLLFKEPKANQLMTLVTDSGYATHDEIAWESLVDVSGQGSEYFSGDFRPVSHNAQSASLANTPAGHRHSSLGGSQQIQSMLDVNEQGGGDWTTVQNRRNRPDTQQQYQSAIAPSSPADDDTARAEQEDHDLALALQLQEEEDDRARRETEARQRENVFEPNRTSGISSSRRNSNNQNPPLPTRPGRNSSATGRLSSANISSTTSAAPAPPPSHGRRTSGRRQSAAEQMPPPTYEQAAARPPFVPAADHPVNTTGGSTANVSAAHSAATAGGSSGGYPYAAAGSEAQYYHNGPAGYGAAASAGAGRGRVDRDKCCVM